MTSAEYKTAREGLGYTQAEAAALLGVDRVTVGKREVGMATITREAELALLSLPKKRKKREV